MTAINALRTRSGAREEMSPDAAIGPIVDCVEVISVASSASPFYWAVFSEAEVALARKLARRAIDRVASSCANSRLL